MSVVTATGCLDDEFDVNIDIDIDESASRHDERLSGAGYAVYIECRKHTIQADKTEC